MLRRTIAVRWRPWIEAVNFPIYSASVVPVLVGASVSWYDAMIFNVFTFTLTLLGLTFLQVAVNLANDYFDSATGVDAEKSNSFVRLVKHPRLVLVGAITFLAIGAGFGFYLDSLSEGHVLIVLGAIGVVLGFIYQAPPFRLSFRGVGEFITFLTFGPMAVLGTYFVQTQKFSASALMASIPIGFLVTSILFIHHFPQYETDKNHGKMTPVVRMGRKRSAKVFTALVFLPFAWIALSVSLKMLSPLVLLVTALLPLAFGAAVDALRHAEGPEVGKVKATTLSLHFFTGVLISVGLVLSRSIFG